MTALKLENFHGMIPRLSSHNLPDNYACTAENLDIQTGAIQGIFQEELVHDFSDANITTAWRVRDPDTSTPINPALGLLAEDVSSEWIGFSTTHSRVVRGPLVNDSYKRFYWVTDDAAPQFNTFARIGNGDPSYKLGIPAPDTAPTVTPSGGNGTDVERAYVYTFVNDFGEESAPSPATLATGKDDGTWDLSNLANAAVDGANRATVDTKNIYRTITGESGTTDYYYVASVPLANTTYSDTVATNVVSRNDLLDTLGHDPPPSGLMNLVAMPGGYLVGNVGRDLYFSVPYKPWAWNIEYQVSLKYNVVGMAVYRSSLVIATAVSPYTASGANPQSLVPIEHSLVQPCLSGEALAVTNQGVIYPSPDGLVLVSDSAAARISEDIILPRQWTDRYATISMTAALHRSAYILYYSSTSGIQLELSTSKPAFSELVRHQNVSWINTDPYTGQAYFVSTGKVYAWSSDISIPRTWSWTSKVFNFPRPVNLSAYRVDFHDLDTPLEAVNTEGFEEHNANITAANVPLAAIGYTSPGGPLLYSGVATSLGHIRAAVGGSGLIDISVFTETANVGVTVTVYVSGEQIYTKTVYDGGVYRLPSGFKAREWQFKFSATRVRLESVTVAETGMELATV